MVKSTTEDQKTVVDPMVVYREVSDWKSKCTELLLALREIRCTDTSFPQAARLMQLTAEQAIQKFERNK